MNANLSSVSLRDFFASNGVTKVAPVLGVSDINQVPFIKYEGKTGIDVLFLSKKLAETTSAKEGTSIRDIPLTECVVVTYNNEQGETRVKLALRAQLKDGVSLFDLGF